MENRIRHLPPQLHAASRPLRGVQRSSPSALPLDTIKRRRRYCVSARSRQPTWPHLVSQKTSFRAVPRRVASTSRLLRNDVSVLSLYEDVSERTRTDGIATGIDGQSRLRKSAGTPTFAAHLRFLCIALNFASRAKTTI
jgi:hypothetical protein